MVVIVMGVSGAGKTLIGQKLALHLSVPFYDADNFHPEDNIRKMHEGVPLTDVDRKPWLEFLGKNIQEWNHGQGAVLACSALKKIYRDQLRAVSAEVIFVYLKGVKSLIAERLEHRKGHFFDPSLLDSQFETLEEPPDAITITIDRTPEDIVKAIIRELR